MDLDFDSRVDKKVFFSGILIFLLPSDIIGEYVGNNSIFALFIPVAFGVVAYFPTLVEVPMANAFLQMGMARGPLMILRGCWQNVRQSMHRNSKLLYLFRFKFYTCRNVS